MKCPKTLRISAEEYAVLKMRVRLMRLKRFIEKNTPNGRISWCNFDKERFEKELSKAIKKIYRKKVNLNELWREVINDPELYVQQDFLENAYGHKFRMHGKYRDYGFVVFYGKTLGANSCCSLELIEKWFVDVLLKNYKKAKSRYNFASNEPFSFSQRWRPICEAAMHFDNKLSKENVKNHIIVLSKLSKVNIKYIGEYEITFV